MRAIGASEKIASVDAGQEELRQRRAGRSRQSRAIRLSIR